MTRTCLAARKLPGYTRGEEIFNMASHAAGAAFGAAALVLCVVVAALCANTYGVVSGAIYGASLIILYTMSSVYHGLKPGTAKKVMQVLDHCTIYVLIAGTYTPVLLSSLRLVYPKIAWTLFAVVWTSAAVGIVLNAIDLKRFKVFSMICYLVMGWCIIFFMRQTYAAIGFSGTMLLLAGGIAYTVGTVFYGLGSKHRYAHSVFHLFILAGSLLQFLSIVLFVMPA